MAVTRARRRLLVTAVSRRGGTAVALPRRARSASTATRPLAAPGRGMHLPGLVAELRAVVCDRALEAGRAGRRRGRAGPAGGSRRPGCRSGRLVGACPAVRRRAGSRPGGPGSRQPVAYRVLPALRAAGAARTARRPRRRRDPGIARHADPRGRGGRVATTPTSASWKRLLDDALVHGSTSGPAGSPSIERVRARAMLGEAGRLAARHRRRADLVAVEQEFDVVVGDARLRGRVDRLERDGPAGPSSSTSRPASPSRRPTTSPSIRSWAPTSSRCRSAGSPRSTRGADGRRSAGPARPCRQELEDQQQPPLGEHDDPTWIARHVAYVADAHAWQRSSAAIDEHLLRQLRREDRAARCMDEGRPVTR